MYFRAWHQPCERKTLSTRDNSLTFYWSLWSLLEAATVGSEIPCCGVNSVAVMTEGETGRGDSLYERERERAVSAAYSPAQSALLRCQLCQLLAGHWSSCQLQRGLPTYLPYLLLHNKTTVAFWPHLPVQSLLKLTIQYTRCYLSPALQPPC